MGFRKLVFLFEAKLPINPVQTTFCLLKHTEKYGDSNLKYYYAALITHYNAICLATDAENIRDYNKWTLIIGPYGNNRHGNIENIKPHENFKNDRTNNNIALITVSNFISIAKFQISFSFFQFTVNCLSKGHWTYLITKFYFIVVNKIRIHWYESS